MADAAPFRQYARAIRDNLKLGSATEHTHRPAFKTFLESSYDGFTATNEPRRIECGAPDFSISRDAGQITIGYIEAKDVGADLLAIERDSDRANPTTPNGEQLKRYREALPNLILTNYSEFRWYADGELRMTTELADGNLSIANDVIQQTDELLSAFLNRSPEPISTSIDLAKRMAGLTRMIYGVVNEGMSKGRASQNVNDLYEAVRKALVPNLTRDDFADMFAQTLAYGLFAARVNHDSGDFHRQNASHHIPPANPFLQQIFDLVAGLHFENEPFSGFTDDLAQLLANSDMGAILADFGARGVRQDPIMNFYETFLAAYDQETRKRRGVYYTPEPVISYIVRSVDHILKERFDCPEGLADYQTTEYEVLGQVDGELKDVPKQAHRVLVLDPACGTGSFLYAVIDHIRQHYADSGKAGMWNGYVREHLLKRIFGFEIMMAPYAMSHLKLWMQLSALDMPDDERSDWSYEFGDDERLSVYLTNSLEQAEQQIEDMLGPMRVITEEANAAAGIKRDLPIMVVIGNPPYAGHSSNPSRRGGKPTWIGELIEDYKEVDGKPLGERNPKWVQNDYVKFIRFGQWRIRQSGAGVLAFITDNNYLDSLTFRGMRQQLMDAFTDIYLLDLHGNSKKMERAPDGGVDQNVFDIEQGVSIAVFVKEQDEKEQVKHSPATVHHADLWGERTAKYDALAASDISTTNWEELEPESPYYLFKPWNDEELDTEYLKWPGVNGIMPINSSGVVTSRDKLTIRWSRDEVMSMVRDFIELDTEEVRSKYESTEDASGWKVRWAQADLKNSGISEDMVTPFLCRPFDTRYTYYTGNGDGFMRRPRRKVMRHMRAGENLGLTFMRQVVLDDEYSHFGVSSSIVGARAFYSSRGVANLAPLYIYPSEQEIAQGLYEAGERQPNLAPEFTQDLEQRLGLNFISDGRGDMEKTFGPEDVLHYIYAIFHSPAYRERYDQFLRVDFPRVPLPGNPDIFRQLAELGGRLTDVHLMNSTKPDSPQVGFPISGDNVIEAAHPKYYAPGDSAPGAESPLDAGRVYIGKNNRRAKKRGQYFDGISPDVWEFRIGGYQPMHKWLQERKGRTLTFDDIDTYRRIAASIQETIALMQEVDEAITQTGGIF